MQQLIRKLVGKPVRWVRRTSSKYSLRALAEARKAAKEDAIYLPVISRLPGLVYGPFRNVSPYRFYINSPVKKIRFELVNETPEVLNFNHVGVWIKQDDGTLVKYKGPFSCAMSSTAAVLPDPNGAMRGDGSNSVSVHSKREVKPWWECEFPDAVNIVCIELFNRKDIWGSRSRGLLFTAYNAEGACITRQSKVTKKGANNYFAEVAQPQINTALAYARANGEAKLADRIAEQFSNWLTKPDADESLKASLLSDLATVNQQISQPTPDLSGERETALTLQVPAAARHLRVVAFAKRGIRQITLNTSADGDDMLLSASAASQIPEDIFGLRDNIWVLQPPHIFQRSLPVGDKPKEVKLWHGGHYSGTAFVQRLVQYSEDGSTWHIIDSTLDNLSARLTLISAQEWLLGMKWTPEFAEELGHFCATYRISQARTTKPLFRKQRHLMPDFFKGIEAGAHSATYLPAVTYTRHGLTVPFRELDSTFLAERMFAFCRFLKDTFGLDAFPCYGTLLGMYRDGDFLPHDDDIDVAVVVDAEEGKSYRESSAMWVERLKAAGVPCRFPTPSSLNVHCYFEDFDMDLFFMYRMPDKPGKIWTHMQGYQVRAVKGNLLEPLSTFEFKGFTFNAPGKIEGFLRDRYGDGWTVPDPTYEL
ncbi:LicD family protein [Alteromonas sp. CYL-A6]|uniref:LicD family protein n=1 Tax=Alteromonas nitratireducens TaxID=3390813 RepID=UPI0034B515AD